MAWDPFGTRANRDRIERAVAVAAILAIALATVAPRVIESGGLLAAQDDPSAAAEHALDRSLSAPIAHREIEAALAADDVDLADSFVELARDRGLILDPALLDRVDAANTTSAVAVRNVQHFARGLISGEPDDGMSLAGTALGDLFVFGDIRDGLREGVRLAKGEQADELVLGLAGVGIAVTAATYASAGVGAPARVGLTLAKAARKTGRIGARLSGTLTRELRGVVDANALRRAFTNVSLTEPALAVRAAREAVKTEKAGGLVRMMGNLGRVQAKAGTQAALEGLKLAETPAEVSRLAKLAEKQGSKTRAILRVLGRAAIALAFLTFDAATWVFGAVLTFLGFCAAAKRAAERATHGYGLWVKRRRTVQRARQLERMLDIQAGRPLLASPVASI